MSHGNNRGWQGKKEQIEKKFTLHGEKDHQQTEYSRRQHLPTSTPACVPLQNFFLLNHLTNYWHNEHYFFSLCPFRISRKLTYSLRSFDPLLSRRFHKRNVPDSNRTYRLSSSSSNRIQLDTEYKLSEGTRAVYEDRQNRAPGFLRGLARTGCAVDWSPIVYVCICASRVLLYVCTTRHASP